MVTLYDVGQRAGVSIATVSRVLHGNARVRQATRDRVLAAIDELGYVPDGAARSLALSRKDVIGLVCVEHSGLDFRQYDSEAMSRLFYDGVLRGVESRLREDRWSLLLTFLREDEGPGAAARLLALSGKVDGLLIGEGVVPPPVMARLARRIPVVAVAGDPALRGVDVVAADNAAGARALAGHLIDDHGARRLFHVDGPPSAPDAAVRRAALDALVAGRPGVAVTGRYEGRFSFSSGERAARVLLERRAAGGLPDAVICANDQSAIGLMRTLQAAGLRIPGDIAVTGFDDVFPASLSSPPLTTVHQPIRELGHRACDRLIARISRPGLRHRVELLDVELVLRGSCGCPPGTDKRRAVAAVGGRVSPPARPPPGRKSPSRKSPGRKSRRSDSETFRNRGAVDS